MLNDDGQFFPARRCFCFSASISVGMYQQHNIPTNQQMYVSLDAPVLQSVRQHDDKSLSQYISKSAVQQITPYDSLRNGARILLASANGKVLCPPQPFDKYKTYETIMTTKALIKLSQFLYCKVKARCVSSYSIPFGLLPKTLPYRGGIALRSRAIYRVAILIFKIQWIFPRAKIHRFFKSKHEEYPNLSNTPCFLFLKLSNAKLHAFQAFQYLCMLNYKL